MASTMTPHTNDHHNGDDLMSFDDYDDGTFNGADAFQNRQSFGVSSIRLDWNQQRTMDVSMDLNSPSNRSVGPYGNIISPSSRSEGPYGNSHSCRSAVTAPVPVAENPFDLFSDAPVPAPVPAVSPARRSSAVQHGSSTSPFQPAYSQSQRPGQVQSHVAVVQQSPRQQQQYQHQSQGPGRRESNIQHRRSMPEQTRQPYQHRTQTESNHHYISEEEDAMRAYNKGVKGNHNTMSMRSWDLRKAVQKNKNSEKQRVKTIHKAKAAAEYEQVKKQRSKETKQLCSTKKVFMMVATGKL